MIRIITILLLILVGCKKPPERSCWKSAGTQLSEIRTLPNLSTINIFDDVNVLFQQDSLNFIEVNSYKNLISFIETNNTETAIEIRNRNKCNTLRSKNIENTVTIHYSNINKINLYGTGKVEFLDTISQYYFEVNSYEARSEFILTINCHRLQCAFVEGSVIGNISGNSDSTYIFQSLYSIVDASKLTNAYLHISNNSTGDAYVQATDKLHIELLNTGNIFYYGNPVIYISQNIGLGKAIAQ